MTEGYPERGLFAKLLILTLKGFQLIPLRVRSLMGGGIGWVVSLFAWKEMRFARLQLKRYLPQEPAVHIGRSVFSQLGRNVSESLDLSKCFDDASFVDLDSFEQLLPMLQADAPRIVLSAHTGNWDLLAAISVHKGLDFQVIGREANNPDVQVALEHLRDISGIKTVWRADGAGAKTIIKTLRSRGMVAALIDQDTHVESQVSPFFGTPAATPIALVELGLRVNANFMYVFCYRDAGTYRFVGGEIKALELQELIDEYHAQLEKLIRRFPNQWVWNHKRWRTDPKTQERRSSEEYRAHLERELALRTGTS